MDDSEAYDAFRRFHSTPGNFRLLVEGISRGFAVEREFEDTLWRTVNDKLKRLGQPDSDDVVVLHGQSGTGKSIGRSDRFVEAPARVSSLDLAAFEKLRDDFQVEPHYGPNTSDSIFAMLYRRLPVARGRLAAGVSSEARAAESVVRDRARHVPRPSNGLSSIAEQLIELGIASPTSQVFEDDEKLAVLGLDAAGRLIDYVMVAGRLNCPVPVNLVFRVLGQTGGLHQDQISHLLADLDLFRWREDEEGSNYMISPRIQL